MKFLQYLKAIFKTSSRVNILHHLYRPNNYDNECSEMSYQYYYKTGEAFRNFWDEKLKLSRWCEEIVFKWPYFR